MFYDIYLYTLCYYICCLLGACMRCTRLCSLKPGVTPGHACHYRCPGGIVLTASGFTGGVLVGYVMHLLLIAVVLSGV
jgi:hypothetical protein